MPRVRVPQKDGEITISRSGEEPVTRHVTDHEVQVAQADLEQFLRVIPGAEVVKGAGSPDSRKKEG